MIDGPEGPGADARVRSRYPTGRKSPIRRLATAQSALVRQLQDRRTALDMPVYELARRSGYSEAAVLRVLNDRPVKQDTWESVARALGFELVLTSSTTYSVSNPADTDSLP